VIIDNQLEMVKNKFHEIPIFTINYETKALSFSEQTQLRIDNINKKLNKFDINYLLKTKELNQWSKQLM
jgi:hypothetical protein